MYSAALKERIQALPDNEFVAVWACIEDIEGALDRVGKTAELALAYVRAAHEEHLAALLAMQEARIAKMTESAVNQHENVTALATQRNAAWAAVDKLTKKLARLTKKTKRKA